MSISRTAIAIAWCLILNAPPAFAQAPARGTLELAPYTGGVFTTTTFEDPDVAGEALTIKSALAGVDIGYYLDPHFSAGVLVTRQQVSAGPASERTTLSMTLAGALAKYRRKISERTGLTIVGGSGIARSRQRFGDADRSGRARGLFMLAGAGVSIALGEHACFDFSVRRVFNHARVDDDPPIWVGGTMAVFGIGLWVH